MQDWWTPRKPTDEIRATPWLHPAAVLYLNSLIKPDWRILEHGAGGSTLWFAERAASVVSIEASQEWREAIRAVAPSNVTLLAHLPPVAREYDLMLIDGLREERPMMIRLSRLYVKPGGVIVLDNAIHQEFAAERLALQKYCRAHISIDANPPGAHYCVTDFYRVPGDKDATWI